MGENTVIVLMAAILAPMSCFSADDALDACIAGDPECAAYMAQPYMQLHKAAFEGNVTRMKELLDEHEELEIDTADGLGVTPLMIAAQQDQRAAVEFCVEKGAKVTTRSKANWTALHYAASRGSQVIAALLLENGAERDVFNVRGETPVGLARRIHRDAVANFIEQFTPTE
jgi:ankyrin repeat protein